MASYLIRDAHLLTMDEETEGLVRGDLLIEDGRIADVAPSISAPGAEAIDGRGMIAMPGLVDSHRHMWAAMLRGGACYGNLHDYFVKVVFSYGAAYTPEDTYKSIRFGLAEAVDSGITTMHGWEHNIQTPAHARAGLQAMRESGMRGRFSYGPSSDTSAGSSFVQGSETIDFEDILKLREEEFSTPGRIHLGIACRGHEFSQEAIWRQEFAFARERGLPITCHSMMVPHDLENGRAVSIYHEHGCSGPTCCSSTASASTMRRSPTSPRPGRPSRSRSSPTCGMGLPPVLKMLRGGVDIGISMDTMAAADNSDMFNAMRITMGIERAKADDGGAYQPMEVLRQGTCTAASTLGLGDVTGALRKGLAADVILLRADDLNMAPLNVLDGQVVLAAQPSNVDTVFIDGVLRKQHGELIGVDSGALVRDVTEAVESLRQRVDVASFA